MSSLRMVGIAKKCGYSPRMCDEMVEETKNVIKNSERSKEAVSSCRHTADKLGISITRANKLIGSSKNFTREIMDVYVDLIHQEQFFALKDKYPKATVIPMPFIKKIAVRFGSLLKMNNSEHDFFFKNRKFSNYKNTSIIKLKKKQGLEVVDCLV